MPSKLRADAGVTMIASQLGKPGKGPTERGPIRLFVIRKPEFQEKHPSSGALDSHGHDVQKPQSFHQGLCSSLIRSRTLPSTAVSNTERNCSKRPRSPAVSCALNNGPVDSERRSSAPTPRRVSNPFSKTEMP